MDAIQASYIEKMYIEMFDKLMVYARSILRNESLAEEAVQETFRIACQKVEQLRGSANPQGWLILTLRNITRDMIHHLDTTRKIMDRYLMSQHTEVNFTEDRMQLNVLYQDIADTEEFKLLSEMAIEGKSHKELAQARGITIDACKKRVQRAKEKLQRKFNK